MLLHFNSNIHIHTCIFIDKPFRSYDSICVEFNSVSLYDRQRELINSICTHINDTQNILSELYVELSIKLGIEKEVIALLVLSNKFPVIPHPLCTR